MNNKYKNSFEYVSQSDIFIKTLYDVMRPFFHDDFNEAHMRFLKADGYEYLIDKYLLFERITGKPYDVISSIDNLRWSIKTQDTIFQMPQYDKKGNIKIDCNGNKLYTQPRNLVMVNSMGGSSYSNKDFDWLLAIQPEKIKNGKIIIPFSIGISSSKKVIKNGSWQGTNNDQFRCILYNKNMKKKGKKHIMTAVSTDVMFDFYREMKSEYSIINRQTTNTGINVRQKLNDFYDNIYLSNQ